MDGYSVEIKETLSRVIRVEHARSKEKLMIWRISKC